MTEPIDDIIFTSKYPATSNQDSEQTKYVEPQAITEGLEQPKEPKGKFAFFKSPRFYLILLIGYDLSPLSVYKIYLKNRSQKLTGGLSQANIGALHHRLKHFLRPPQRARDIDTSVPDLLQLRSP